MEKHILSKSTFIKGLQCEKALYLSKYHRELKDELSTQQEAIFSQGTKVGELAQDLFPGGVDCTPESYFDFQQAVIRTQEEIATGIEVIYEAAFQFNGVLAALDILFRDEEGWKAYEVKSSTSVSDTYVLDASIQYYAITNSGIDLKDISIVYINNQYVRKGAIDIHQLFTIETVKDRVLQIQAELPSQIDRLKQVLLQKEVPDKEIGPHCSSPYGCDFAGHCWKHVPNNSVFDVAGLFENKKFELYQQGIMHLKDIPEDYPLSEQQWMQVHAESTQETIVKPELIKGFLNKLNYPLYYLDFETFASAVPLLDNSRPYQQMVFQYSLHTEQADGGIEHREFLAAFDGSDPRDKFVKQLILDCGTFGDIIVYNIGFERGKVNELTHLYPQYQRELVAIMNRMVDLMLPFQHKWYYTPSMQGSYSIKKVLPALVPKLSYDNLEIKEGGTASSIFTSMFAGKYNGDIEQTRKNLLVYCKLDTWAMVEILKFLKKI
jgi:hypothetical protein